MKLVRLPTTTGSDWWVVIHELTLAEGRLRKLRPIHVFAYLVQFLVQDNNQPKVGELSLWLENKLFGVRFHYFEFRKAIAEVEDPVYRGKYVRDYDDQQKVICTLEAYLNAIYSALEITSLINKSIYPELPIGFKRQSKKFEAFSFSKWEWLLYFFDIRSELMHFSSPLPTIEKRSLLIKIISDKGKFILKKGSNSISLSYILNFSINLFTLLDEWAKKELTKVDPEKTTTSIFEMGLNSPLKIKETKAKEILKLLDS